MKATLRLTYSEPQCREYMYNDEPIPVPSLLVPLGDKIVHPGDTMGSILFLYEEETTSTVDINKLPFADSLVTAFRKGEPSLGDMSTPLPPMKYAKAPPEGPNIFPLDIHIRKEGDVVDISGRLDHIQEIVLVSLAEDEERIYVSTQRKVYLVLR